MTLVNLTVNGAPVSCEVEPRTHLADFLREQQLLTGTHIGCEHGICGACTVLIDGVPARSCITFPATLEGAEITTIEGIDADPVAVKLREAFSREHALQCGYCTPGMMMMARDIVMRLPGADAATIRKELAGNLCRCTGYVGIVKAIEATCAEAAANDPVTLAPLVSPARPLAVTLADEAGPASTARLEPITFEEAENGATRINQAFTVAFPRARVWAFFEDPRKVVAAMPGAHLTALSDDHFEGEMRIRLGPMGARFAGEGEIANDAATHTGTITGRGTDQGSATRASGRVVYTLSEPAPGTTRVSVAVEYMLVGALAQVSRGGIARDLAARLTRAFAENLDAALAGRTPAEGAGELSAGALLLSAVKDWLSRLFRRG
ncbi:xanthine dehydrogenase family Fe-S subunit [Acuticoccus mangrovi]|uniref:2Fe-2S iron-sulfur cluster binding domain-containing protein n=1 Tax=Acuticoccus mangrovi TaxID=2796142 RepID=A0A934IR44_9HYPH|nr:2Fe-2S iron-sulfur cluster-binding protein [Acuticoccus mangrovi]MBJ3776737.1 2Fe-2S iron-sulfur cluster binding domain-containing protein [Acuticoccus mangrovi]